MSLGYGWLPIVVCVVVGQVFLTLWFAVIFAKPWALAYGVSDPKEHTAAIPPYTYGLGALCVLALTLGLAALLTTTGARDLGAALGIGLWVAGSFSLATALPGYAFLKRWRAFLLAMGSQTALILVLVSVLALWPRSSS